MDILSRENAIHPIAYDDFTKDGTYDLKEFTFDQQTLDFWHGRSFYVQMMDVWGEVDKARNNYITLQKVPVTDDELRNKRYEVLLDSLRFVRECIAVVREGNDFAEPVKQTFRIAEWELYDFCLWDNVFMNTADTVTHWFDQWCYDINAELLV